MQARPLHAVLRRTRALLESRSASFWTIGAWIALTLVWVVPFQVTGQPAETITAIAEDWLVFRVVYALVGLTTLVCAITRISRDFRRLQSARPMASPTQEAVRVDGIDLSDAARRLQDAGFAVTVEGEAIYAAKNAASVLGGSLFHLGIVLLGVALVGHLMTVNTVSLRVTEGQSFAEAAADAGVVLPSRVRDLTLVAIEPRYYRDVLLFTRLEARASDAAGEIRTLSLSQPLWAAPTALMSIGDYNLAPHIEVSDFRGDKPIPVEYVVAMNLSPPGTEDSADIPDVPLDISLIAYPDHGVVDGRDVSLSYNIANPAFVLAVSERGRSGSLLARELVTIGQAVNAGDYIVRITALSRYGTFRITTAPALPFMALAWLVTSLGVAWRYLLRRQTVLVWAEADGVLVDGWLDLAGRGVGRSRAVGLLGDREEAS